MVYTYVYMYICVYVRKYNISVSSVRLAFSLFHYYSVLEASCRVFRLVNELVCSTAVEFCTFYSNFFLIYLLLSFLYVS